MNYSYTLGVLFSLIVASVNAQNLDGFFNKYADDERFSYTKIGKTMQTLTLDINTENKKLAESLENEIFEILKKENFELEVASREKNERSYIYSRQNTGSNLFETVIINRDKSEINILWTVGKNKKKSLNTFEIPGLDNLSDSLNPNHKIRIDILYDLDKLKELECLESLDTLKIIKISTNEFKADKTKLF